MPPRPIKPGRIEPPDLRLDSQTLCYEVEMLGGSAQKYIEARDQVAVNVTIESFAIHCRSLIFFLFGHLDEITAGGKTVIFGHAYRDNDVFAFDFFPGWGTACPPSTAVLVNAKWQADKHVAHIVRQRRGVNRPGSEERSTWNLHQIITDIMNVLGQFLRLAPAGNFDAEALRRMNQYVADWNRDAATSAGPIVAMSGPQL